MRLAAGRAAAWAATIAFMVAPLGLLWSRASLMETLAVAASLGSVYGMLRWDRSGSRQGLVIAIGLGMVASLVKITTAVVWLVPALFLVRRSRLGPVAVVGVAMVVGVAWTTYADSIKLATPAMAALASSNPGMRDWNFGSIRERLDPATWTAMIPWVVGLLGPVLLLSPRSLVDSRLARWSIATIAIALATFTNLFSVHDYYWMALGPAFAILVGLSVARIWALPDRGVARSRTIGAVGLVVISFYFYPRWIRAFGSTDETDTLRLAAQVQAQSSPGELVAIQGRGWSPAVLFYAERRGFTEWDGAQRAPGGYARFECPAEGKPGDCVRLP